MKNTRRIVFALFATLTLPHLAAAAANIRVFEINDHLTAFYAGRPLPAQHPEGTWNWADYGALDVGVATYAIHSGDRALVYDAFTSVELAGWVRDYLTKAGIKHFTLVNSHWHLDHTGGNAVYADCDRIATEGTIRQLNANRAAIESGSLWGPPAITPLVVPNIGITSETSFHVGDTKVELRPVKIHSDDGLVVYLPDDRFLLAGDTLEDTVTFIAEPEHVVDHYKNMQKMKQWEIDRIFPNHGNPDVISAGGYRTTLIDATLSYLRKVILRSHDPDYASGTLEDYVGASVKKGWVSIWWAYRQPHQDNLKQVATALKDKPLPDLPE